MQLRVMNGFIYAGETILQPLLGGEAASGSGAGFWGQAAQEPLQATGLDNRVPTQSPQSSKGGTKGAGEGPSEGAEALPRPGSDTPSGPPRTVFLQRRAGLGHSEPASSAQSADPEVSTRPSRSRLS